MDSSTSSSDAAGPGADGLGRAARLVGLVTARTALVALALLLAAGVWSLLDPTERAMELESIIVDEQDRRARTIGAADIVIAGDSSGLVDVDAPLMSAQLGRRVESLATVAFAGPIAFAAVLGEYTRRHSPGIALFVLHGETLQLDEETIDTFGLETFALSGTRPRAVTLVEGARRKIYRDVLGRVTDFPLPGAYGVAYGTRLGLRDALHHGQGTIADHTSYWPEDYRANYRFALSDAIARRLAPALTAPPGVVSLLVITPVPASTIGPDTEATRIAVAQQIVRIGERRWAWLETPTALDDRYFSTISHLNAAGRTVFSRLLAERVSAAVASPR